jgi:hypothetical protein
MNQFTTEQARLQGMESTATELDGFGWSDDEQGKFRNMLHALIAEATLSRWETGAQIQQRAMDAFLRVFFRSAEARGVLGVPDVGSTSLANSGAMITIGNIR